MKTLKIELEVAKESYELGNGIGRFILTVKEALKDGWQADKDLPIIISSAVAELIPAIQGIEDIPTEIKSIKLFANSLYAGLGQALLEFIPKKEEVQNEVTA